MIGSQKFNKNSGYRLRDLKNGLWQIHSGDGQAFEGSFVKIFKQCVAIGIDPNEVECAVLELKDRNHDYAEFGIYKTFMYTVLDEAAA